MVLGTLPSATVMTLPTAFRSSTWLRNRASAPWTVTASSDWYAPLYTNSRVLDASFTEAGAIWYSLVTEPT